MNPMVLSESGSTLREQLKPNTFQNVLQKAIATIEDTERASRMDSYRLAFGEVDDLSQVIINSMKMESMVQTTVQITTRVVNAYKEIINMQI